VAHLAIVILATGDLPRLADFYSALTGWKRLVDEEAYVEFDAGGARLGVYEANAFGRNLDDDPSLAPPPVGDQLTRTEIYVEVPDVRLALETARRCGATVLSETRPRSWGQDVAYVKDPDGNVCALAGSN
jgi:lactoylglutathione lyase